MEPRGVPEHPGDIGTGEASEPQGKSRDLLLLETSIGTRGGGASEYDDTLREQTFGYVSILDAENPGAGKED